MFRAANAAQRVDYAAYSIVAHMPRAEWGRWAGASDPGLRDRLKTAIGAWYAASSLSREAFRTRFLNPYTSDETVDNLRAAARGLVEAKSHADLGSAAETLAAVAQKIGPYGWPRFVSDASHQAVDAVAQGGVPGVTLVATVAAAGGAGAVAGPGAVAVLGRAAVRVATGLAAAALAPEAAAVAAVVGTVALARWVASHGEVHTAPIAGFGPADRGVAPVSAAVNGKAGTVLLYHGLPHERPDTATQHSVELRVGADGLLSDRNGKPVARLGMDGQVVPLPGVDIPGLFHGPAATPPLPGTSVLSDADRRSLSRPEKLPIAPAVGPNTTANPAPAPGSGATVLPGSAIAPQVPQVFENRGDPGLTRPTGPINGAPTGPRSKTQSDGTPDDKAQVDSENQVSDAIAAAGYKTVQNPTEGHTPVLTPERLKAEGLRETADPDLLIEDRIFDTYTPVKDDPDKIRNGIAGKIDSRQTQRVVVDLRNTTQTEAAIRRSLLAKPIRSLREVVALTKNGLGRPFRP